MSLHELLWINDVLYLISVLLRVIRVERGWLGLVCHGHVVLLVPYLLLQVKVVIIHIVLGVYVRHEALPHLLDIADCHIDVNLLLGLVQKVVLWHATEYELFIHGSCWCISLIIFLLLPLVSCFNLHFGLLCCLAHFTELTAATLHSDFTLVSHCHLSAHLSGHLSGCL